jgi:hypothetical protein
MFSKLASNHGYQVEPLGLSKTCGGTVVRPFPRRMSPMMAGCRCLAYWQVSQPDRTRPLDHEQEGDKAGEQ